MAVHRARWNRLLILKRGEKQWGPIYQGKSNKFPNRNHTECLSTPQFTICTLYFYRKKSVLYFTPKVIVIGCGQRESKNAKYTASLLFNLSFFRRLHLWKNTQIISSSSSSSRHRTQRNTTDHLLNREIEVICTFIRQYLSIILYKFDIHRNQKGNRQIELEIDSGI